MEQYIKNKDLAKIPKTWQLLKDHRVDINDAYWGLDIMVQFDDAAISLGEDFLDHPSEHHFIGLGQATSSGSIYTVFVVDPTKPFEEQPIVAFGDEGQICLVAKDFDDFLKLLTIGCEVYLDYDGLDGAYFPEPEEGDLEEEQMETLEEFRQVMRDAGFPLCEFWCDSSYEFQDEIIQAAQVYQKPLKKTLKRIAPNIVIGLWEDEEY